jgi:uncharacterized membrane protein SpoIIM required for sporulation
VSHVDDEQRAETLYSLASRASRDGLARLGDAEVLKLISEQRWAVGRLASLELPLVVRSLLNAAILRAHGVLHRRSTSSAVPLAVGLRRVAMSTLLSAAVFFGSAALAMVAVLADPWLSLSLVPRQLLAQIDGDAWGSRGSTLSNLGMTLFYWGNNLRASFLALSLGVLAGLPALLVLAFNGMLMGAVAGSAIHRGVGDRLWAWIAPHGVPEIGALILCGAIGWELGLSWIRPGSSRRRDALATAGRELLPVALVAALLVIAAAPLEGFVAPLALPWWADVAIPIAWVVVLGAASRYALWRNPGAPA